MKKLFQNAKTSFKYILTITIAFILLGGIFVGFLGFNKSTELNNFYQIEIKYLGGAEEQTKTLNAINNVIDSNSNYKKIEVLEEETGYYNVMCVRFFSESNVDAEAIANQLKADLEISANNMVFVNKITNSYYRHMWLQLIFASLVSIALLFIYGLVRQDWQYATAYAINFVSTILVGLSAIAIARIPLSFTSLLILYAFAVISTVIFMIFVSKLDYNLNQEEYNDLFLSELFYNDIYKNKLVTKLIVLGVSLLAISSMLFMGQTFYTNAALASYASLFACLYSFAFFASIYFTAVDIARNEKLAKVLSRNNLDKQSENKVKANNVRNSNSEEKNTKETITNQSKPKSKKTSNKKISKKPVAKIKK